VGGGGIRRARAVRWLTLWTDRGSLRAGRRGLLGLLPNDLWRPGRRTEIGRLPRASVRRPQRSHGGRRGWRRSGARRGRRGRRRALAGGRLHGGGPSAVARAGRAVPPLRLST